MGKGEASIAIKASLALGARDASSTANDEARLKEAQDLALREEEALWASRVLDGESRLFAHFVKRYQRRVFVTVLRFVGREAEAEDLTQQAFINAYKNLARFDPDRAFVTWILRIGVNQAKDWLKSHKRREDTSLELVAEKGDCEPNPEESALAQERNQQLEQAMRRLPIKYREILLLKDLQGHTFPEISEILGSPVTALKIRAVRARTQLKKLIGTESV